MRTVIHAVSNSEVDVTEENFWNGFVTTTQYFAPSSGGYVYRWEGNDARQVCEHLASTGITLRWNAHAPLSKLIRQEYHRAKAAERRERQRESA